MGDHCWLGPLNLHTWNFEKTECIWCGPGKLAWQSGHWVHVVSASGDYQAWSVGPEHIAVEP